MYFYKYDLIQNIIPALDLLKDNSSNSFSLKKVVEPSLATSNFLKNESVWGVCWEIMTVACKMGFRGTVLCILVDGCTCWNAIGIDASKMKCNVYRCITTFQAFQTDWRYKIILFDSELKARLNVLKARFAGLFSRNLFLYWIFNL